MIKAGLLGKDIKYSYSKIIHEAIDASYDIIDVNEINEFFSKEFDYDFINVTKPYKKEVIKYLDYLDSISKEIGACNLIIKKNNHLYGYNTDYYGFIRFLENNNIDFEGKRVCVLGSGGASQMIQKVALDKNAKRLYVVSREEYLYLDNYITYDEIGKYEYDILINATPVGTSPNYLDLLIDFDKIRIAKGGIVIDLIYNPLRTKLLIEANNHGFYAYNGLEMLIYQALYSYYLFDDKYKDLINDDELFEKLYSMVGFKNYVIIGMPYAGKTTLGKRLSEEEGKELFDIDEIIESRYGTITSIFKKNGEEYFRKIEKEVIKEIALKNNCIIVPGAGAILDYENYVNLKANGYFIFIDTDFSELLKRKENDDSRPLVKNNADLKKLYNLRHDIYLKYCDEVRK